MSSAGGRGGFIDWIKNGFFLSFFVFYSFFFLSPSLHNITGCFNIPFHCVGRDFVLMCVSVPFLSLICSSFCNVIFHFVSVLVSSPEQLAIRNL